MAQFWHKGYYYPRPPFVPTVCQKIVNFDRIGGLGLLLPWSLTNSGLWPHTPNVYRNYVAINYDATELSGNEECPVALQWQSGKQLTKWLSIGKIDPNLVSVAVDWSEWYPSGTVALDWLPLDMFYICVMNAFDDCSPSF